MPLDDLDLEFEDEDEAKRKKNEAVHIDVDLEFHTPEQSGKPRPAARPGPPAGNPAAPPARPVQRPMAEVKNLSDARPQAQARPAQAQPIARAVSAPQSSGSSALKEDSHFDFDNQSVVQMREEMRRVEFEAEVKVGIAEFKTELLSELLSDMKLMDHQINQLLVRINAKHPDMKQEVLMIKKILADFTSKKRK